MPVFIDGHHLITPTSTAKTGTGSTATINTNGSVTFSSCATLSLDGVFSADYDNYIIMMRHLHTTSSGAAMSFRLRSSGTDATGSNYTWQYLVADGSTTGSDRSADTAGRFGNASNNLRSGDVAVIYGPFLAQPTATRSTASCGQPNAPLVDYTTTHSVSSSYDGITLLTNTGAVTGLVCVYGAVK